jgi:hypothetical protein
MNKVVLGIVFAAFAGLNAYALYADGLIEGFAELIRTSNMWGAVLATDLVIALSLVAGWLIKDARKAGVSPAPYLALTVATGSIGPLLYLLRRKV